MTDSPYFKKNIDRTVERSVERTAELECIEREAIANFKGQLPELSSAIGMLRMGDHFGWRVLYLIHSKKTIRKYENILNIKIKSFFPEVGPSADRSLGYKIAKGLSNFWKVVSGEIKIDNKREISPD